MDSLRKFFIFVSNPLACFSSQSENPKSSRLLPTLKQPKCRMSEIQTDILELILKRLTFIDIVRLRAVCCAWKMAVDSYISSPICRPFPQAPWLLHRNIKFKRHLHFFNPTETKFYKVKQRIKNETKSCIRGSLDDGWVLILEETSNMFLENPFSRAKIQLPRLSTFITSPKIHDIRFKVVLGNKSSVAAIMIVYGCYCWPENLAFCKLGDNTWKPTQLENQSYLDIICHNDQIHALSSTGKIDIWDFLSPFPTKTIDFGGFPMVPTILYQRLHLVNIYGEPSRITYLMKSLDEVLIVDKIVLPHRIQTIGFMVSKLDYKEGKIIPLQNLHGRAIFISSVLTAVSALARDCPEFEGNLIYCDPKNYLAVYNLEEQRVKRYEKLRTSSYEHFWVFPNP